MSKKLTKEDLLAARGLIELGWTHGTPVEDDYSDPSNPNVSYCLAGAIAKVLFDDPYVMYNLEASYVFEEFVGLSNIPLRHLGAWSDVDDEWDHNLGEPDWTGSVYNFNDDTCLLYTSPS